MTSPGIPRGLFLAALITLAAAPSWAAAQITDSRSTCTANNCQSKTINGSYRLDQAGRAVPFEAEIFSSGGECVRVHVTAQAATQDLEIVLVSPAFATFWRNDDGGAGTLPLVKAITNANGWYTLQISNFDGVGATGAFTVKYGRYNAGNPNCNNPTPPDAPGQSLPKPQ